jgi:hypothetical protein
MPPADLTAYYDQIILFCIILFIFHLIVTNYVIPKISSIYISRLFFLNNFFKDSLEIKKQLKKVHSLRYLKKLST